MGCGKYKPMTFPGKVRPLAPGESAFTLGADEAALFNSVAEEQINISGTSIDFYSQLVTKATRDPLYDEPTKRVWSAPYKIKAWVSWATSAPMTSEEGYRISFEGTCWVAKSALDKINAPYPKDGDVFKFWDVPFFQATSIGDDERITAKGWYFDVVNADNDGHINDTPSFVGFRIDIKRRSEFGAERRLTPP